MNLFPRVPNSKRAKADAARAGGQMPGPGQSGLGGLIGMAARVLDIAGVVPIKTNAVTGIPQMTGTTPGMADCALMTWDGTTFQQSSPTIYVRVYNFWNVAAGVSKQAVAFRWAGTYWLLTWRC